MTRRPRPTRSSCRCPRAPTWPSACAACAALRRDPGRRRRRPRRRARRGARPARPQRRRARRPPPRSSRATATATAARSTVLGHDPAHADAALAQPPRHRAADRRRPRRPHRRGVGARTSPATTPARATSTRSSRRSGSPRSARTRGFDLSGGQRRRLDVALGIIGRPELLFLDEPTTGFDPEARREFWDLIREPARARARRSCSPPTTSTRPRCSPTASRSSPAGASSPATCPSRLGGRDESHGHGDVARGRRGAHRADPPSRPGSSRELAARLGGEVPGARVHRPSLEDVYLSLIGARHGGRVMTTARPPPPAAPAAPPGALALGLRRVAHRAQDVLPRPQLRGLELPAAGAAAGHLRLGLRQPEPRRRPASRSRSTSSPA